MANVLRHVLFPLSTPTAGEAPVGGSHYIRLVYMLEENLFTYLHTVTLQNPAAPLLHSVP